MKFPALKTKELNNLCSSIVEDIKRSKAGESRQPEVIFVVGENTFLDDLRDEGDLEIVLTHLKKYKVINNYEINHDTETPIEFINKIVLEGVSYTFVEILYDHALSIVRINLNRTSFSNMSPDRMLTMGLPEFTFEIDTVYHHMSTIELSGNQAKLCYLLFEKYPINYRIKESEIREYLTGDYDDDLLDLKDLVKTLNRKFKEELGLLESIIRQKDATVYRTR